jgi:hypothetical protein
MPNDETITLTIPRAYFRINRALESFTLDDQPILEFEQIGAIDHGYLCSSTHFFLGNIQHQAPVMYIADRELSFFKYPTWDVNGTEIIDWFTANPEEVASAMLYKQNFDDIEIQKYLVSFTQKVLVPLKEYQHWALTSNYVNNAFRNVQREDGPVGFVAFKPSLGRDGPLTWIIQPDRIRAIDTRTEFDQPGFAGMVSEGRYAMIFHRSNAHDTEILDCRTDLMVQAWNNLDWRRGNADCQQVALAMLATLFDADLAIRLHIEFSRRVVEHLPHLWWSLTETSVRATVEEILKDPPKHKPNAVD